MTTTYPDGEVVTSTYNNQGVDTLNSNYNNFITASTYTASSQLDTLTFGNGAVTDYTYNAQNLRLTDIVTTKTGTTLLDIDYTFDNVGNILTAKHNVGTGGLTTYTYDDLNRLMSATATLSNTYTRSWTYTTIGNTLTRNDGGGNLTYVYDPTVRPHAVKQIGSNYFCYDNNGNMTRRNSNAACSSGDQLTYDVENRMTSMTVGATTTNMKYNGDGTRVSREVAGVGTTYYVGNHYEIYDPVSGTTTFNKYYYFGANRVAARIGSTTPSNGTLFYMQGDHLGSSSLVMTSGGALQARQTYYPFGAKRTTEPNSNSMPAGMDYTFTGQKSDDSTGLMYYGARYYDTTLGRFTQADTIVPDLFDPQSFNRYSYVNNNPVRYTDPTGHMLDEPDDGGDNNNGGGGFVDDRPYCERFPYANGCYTPTPPTDSGSNQNPDTNGGDSCWPRCNRDDEADAQAQAESYPQEPPRAKCPGNCFPPASGPDPLRPDKPAGGPLNTSGNGFKNGPTGQCNVFAPHIYGCRGYDGTFRANAPRTYPDPQANKAAGDKFRDQVAENFRKMGYEVKTEVNYRTPFGNRRMDIDLYKNGDHVGAIETKFGPNARYTPSQRAKDYWLENYSNDPFRIDVIHGR